MQRIFLSLLAALAIVVLPQYVAAHEENRPQKRHCSEARHQRPNPEMIFHRLDANRDGVIVLDEIPDAMPERLKHLLVWVIKSHDGKLTKKELVEAIKHRRPGMHRPGMRPTGGPPPGRHASQRPVFDARAIFNRLDKDRDGKLSFREFSAGLGHLRRVLARAASAWSMPQKCMVRFACQRMSTGGAEFAKSFYKKGHQCPCPCCRGHKCHKWAMGHWRPDGQQWAMGYRHHDGWQWTMGYRHHEGRQWAMMGYHRHHDGRPWAMGQKHPEGKGWSKDYKKHPKGKGWSKDYKKHSEGKGWSKDYKKHPKGKGWFEDQKRPEGKKPGMKKQGPKEPVEKASAKKRTIEARLVALERQQAEILSLLWETTLEHKELAKAGKKAKKHPERKRRPHADQRD